MTTFGVWGGKTALVQRGRSGRRMGDCGGHRDCTDNARNASRADDDPGPGRAARPNGRRVQLFEQGDSEGIAGRTPVNLTFVRRDGTYLRNDKGRFVPMGAHWVASNGLHWPLEWEPKEIRADFAAMKALGFNAVRIDLFWAWFEPYPGQYNPQAFSQLDEFVRLAHEFGIYLHPCMFIGGETGYYDIPYRHGRHPHADPDLLRLQTDHARQIASRYRDEPAILAWDLTDEPPFWIVRAPHTTDAMAINWTRLVAGAVRRVDSRHLVCVGTDQEDLRRGPFRPDLLADEVDFFSSHQYPIYMPSLFPDPMLSVRMTYAGAFRPRFPAGREGPS